MSDDDCDDDLDDNMFLCNAKARIIIIIINFTTLNIMSNVVIGYFGNRVLPKVLRIEEIESLVH